MSVSEATTERGRAMSPEDLFRLARVESVCVRADRLAYTPTLWCAVATFTDGSNRRGIGASLQAAVANAVTRWPRFSVHARNRYLEVYPDAGLEAMISSWIEGEPLSQELVEAVTGRRPALGSRPSEYRRDAGGIWAVDPVGFVAVTFLRTTKTQQEVLG